MKQSIILFFLLLGLSVQSQNTEVFINDNNIGINIASPSSYFHLDVPSNSTLDGFYSRINHNNNDDIHAIEGHCIGNPGYGVGGYFTGGFRGVYALGSGGSSANSSFPTYGLYALSTGTAGTRIGLFSEATGGSKNLAAQFGNGDIEIEDNVRINTTDQSARLSIANTDNNGSNATAVKITASNNGSESTFGTIVNSTNESSGNAYGHYATVSTLGSGTAYAFRGIATNANDFAFYGTGNSYFSGDVRIGQNVDPYQGDYKVVIDGKVLAEEVRVQNSLDWPDYVFNESYRLRPLAEVEDFIDKNSHLPNIPSAIDIEKNGIILGEMQTLMMEKIEELTLYIIQQEKRISSLEDQLKNSDDDK